MRSLRFIPLLFLGLLGCRSVASSEMTGTWVISVQSRQRLLPASQRNAVGEITLEPDGKFIASEVPGDLLYGPPAATDRLVTGSGSWKLVSYSGSQQVQLEFSTITKGQEGNLPYGTMLNVSIGMGATINLYYFQGGDADQGRRITFKKK